MTEKPTYEELEYRVQVLEKESVWRKQAEQALRKSEEKLQSFMDSATDGFILFDSELNYIEINKSALEIIGLEAKDVIGKNATDMVPNLEETSRYDEYKKVMKTGVPFHIPDLISHPLAGDKHVELKAFKVGDDLGMIISDITKRKQAEEKNNIFSQAILNALDGIVLTLIERKQNRER